MKTFSDMDKPKMLRIHKKVINFIPFLFQDMKQHFFTYSWSSSPWCFLMCLFITSSCIPIKSCVFSIKWILLSIASKLFYGSMLSSHVYTQSLHTKALESQIAHHFVSCIFFSSNLSRWQLFSYCQPIFNFQSWTRPMLHQ